MTSAMAQTQKKRGSARFSASGPAGLPVGHAASSSVVSVAPVSSKGIVLFVGPFSIGDCPKAVHADLVDERYSQPK
ncbi:hypothetical protein [Rhizobium sp.]|jgi:hypothetical protein|uniref:hypothetical protein n=2 Tax=unclassified Rhizobium TaxID=2613769 RepID=UPI0013AEE722